MKKRKTPFQQLIPLLTASEKPIVTDILLELKVDVAEAMCLALVAYIRFGVYRHYTSPFLSVIYQSLVELIDCRKA